MTNDLEVPARCPGVLLSFIATLLLTAGASGQCDPNAHATINLGGSAVGVATSGSTAYVARGSLGLSVVDVSDPANPVFLGAIDPPGIARGVDAVGITMYVAQDDRGLLVIDASDPAVPVIRGQYDTVPRAVDVVVVGNLAYLVVDPDGLVVVDVSDPTNPTLLGTAATPCRAYAVDVSGSVAYVADDCGLSAIDVLDPVNPAIIGSIATGQTDDVTVSCNLAYLSQLAGQGSINVIDVSNPTNPVIVGTVSGGGREIAVSGTRVYSSFGQVIDVSDPTNPVVVGQAEVSGLGVAVAGDVAYIASSAGLHLIDVSTCPGEPVFGACCLGGCLDPMTEVTCVAIGGAYRGNDSACADGACFADDCAGAVPINNGDTAFSTLGATTDGPALPEECREGQVSLSLVNEIWYRYTPTESGTLTVSTCNQASYDTRLAAYTGDCGSLAIAACNDDADGCGLTSQMQVPVTTGLPVLLRVGGFSGSGTGTLTLDFDGGCDADITGDRIIGFADVLRILAEWGPCPE